MHAKNLLNTIGSFLVRPAKRKLILWSRHFQGKKGLEIGGPSSVFSIRGNFPIYLFADVIDGVNYSNETPWEGKISEGKTYKYFNNEQGHQFIREATDLHGIKDETYDFVLSCHSLEHLANPLKALKEWNRVLKPKGLLVIIVPDKRYTFDLNRSYTSMDHLVDDFNKNVGEDDTTHFEEILTLSQPCIVRTP
jgi:SAM-dependent methyltransferase